MLNHDLEVAGKRLCADIIFVERLNCSFGLLGRLGVFAKYAEIAFCERVKHPFVSFRKRKWGL